MTKVNTEFYCNICDKYYKSINSFCNHKRKFHNNDNHNIIKYNHLHNHNIIKYNHSTLSKKETDAKKFYCKFCNKEFTHYQNRWRHQKNCKEDNSNLLKSENDNLKKELKEMKQQMMILMNKTCKMHPKTLQKINNQLNNYNITNINIVQFGKEDIMNTLSRTEKLKILNNGYQSFNKLIEYIHFNDKYPQFKNIAITNLKDNIAYKYDNDDNKFIACKKDELLEDLMDIRTIDLEEILNENIDTINNVKVSKLKSSIEKLYNKNNFYDKQKSDIKLMIYNKSEKDGSILI